MCRETFKNKFSEREKRNISRLIMFDCLEVELDTLLLVNKIICSE